MYSRFLYLLCAILLAETWVVVIIDEGQAQPSSAVAYNNKGIVFNTLGKYDDAVDSYKKAINLDQNYAEAWANLGVTYSSNNSTEEAIQAFSKSLSINQKQGWVWYAMGSAYYKLGDYTDAISAYDNAINLNKADANAWADKGYALFNIGNYEKAIQAFDESTRIDPTKAWVWNGKGSAYYKLGRNEEALDAYDKAINLEPNASIILPRGNGEETPVLEASIKEPASMNEADLNVKARIIDPQNGQTVPNEITVHGKIEGMFPADNYLWLLVGEQAVNLWWPQGGGMITPIKEEWSKKAVVGGGPNLDIGKEQQMIIMLVDEKVHLELKEWVETGSRTNIWPGIELPVGKVLDKISVVKGKG